MVLSSEEYCQNPYLFFQNLEVENGPMFCDISDAIPELWPEGALKRCVCNPFQGSLDLCNTR
ncbi:hypothetical protein Sinme_6960 (plasmid) [Sinorhizobium meliloti AK83]|nr:hypothetical protein Sinme_6960 [Sinorhizobium meliloti AK83]SEJ84828.1 hypothetical protein SAMN04244575_06550 [Sinorhizobium meliloti]